MVSPIKLQVIVFPSKREKIDFLIISFFTYLYVVGKMNVLNVLLVF